jgi:predicted aspartyl protease
MRTSTDFEPDRDLIIVTGAVTGPAGRADCRMILDTGCAITTLTPELARTIGYGSRDGLRRSTVSAPGGVVPGFFVVILELVALGFRVENVLVNVSEFDVTSHQRRDDLEADALLGLTFLDHFNYEIRSYESRILVERADE